MDTPNLPGLESIASMGLSAIVELPASHLAQLQEDAAREAKRFSDIKGVIEAAVREKFRAAIDSAYAAKGDKLGTVTLEAEGPTLILSVDTPKRVNWDQDGLARTEERLRREWQADPTEYITVKRSVSETAYKAWPTPIKAMFKDHREVKPGKQVVKFVHKEA